MLALHSAPHCILWGTLALNDMDRRPLHPNPRLDVLACLCLTRIAIAASPAHCTYAGELMTIRACTSVLGLLPHPF